jgi:hypothetical protein
MRKTKLFALSALFSLGLLGQSPSPLTGGCRNGGAYPSCIGGEIVFTGSNYPTLVHVTVTNSSGKVIDDGDYTTNGGSLTFTENLSFADTYTISVSHDEAVLNVLTVTTG